MCKNKKKYVFIYVVKIGKTEDKQTENQCKSVFVIICKSFLHQGNISEKLGKNSFLTFKTVKMV